MSSHTFRIACHRLVADIPPPQAPVPQRILDGHQTEVPSSIGRIHLDDYLLLLGYLADITHVFQVPGYRSA